jgi:hypothetical protein
MATEQQSVKPGDRFIRLGPYETVWVVKRLLDMEDMPPHLHLTPEGSGARLLTFSVAAVQDEKFFKRLSNGG